MRNKAKLHIVLTAILFAAVLPALTQTPGGKPATSYVIVSPNTRESLTDQDARASLTSYEQVNAVAVADRIACSLARSRRPVALSDALGVYDASAENSFIVETSLPLLDTEYLAELLGRYSHQEFVLLFLADTKSARSKARQNNDRLWIIRTPQPLDQAIAAARNRHLTPMTARETKAGVELWIADIGNKSAPSLTALAEELKATPEVHQGRAELIGDQARMKAQELFDKKLRTLEEHRKQRLSVDLWTKRWHDATTRTCSAEIVP